VRVRVVTAAERQAIINSMPDDSSGLDGEQLYHAFYSGMLHVRERQDELNRINVFPVPDGDTGTNMVATLATALDSVRVSDSAGETLASFAEAALAAARGNSGVILAQFLVGLAESVDDARRMEKESLVSAVENAQRRTYEAVANPQEGTILSVIGAWAEALRRELGQSQSMCDLLARTLPPLRSSLERTREQLEALRRAGVVDAGASGFVEFVAGAASFIHSGIAPEQTASTGSKPLTAGAPLRLHADGFRLRYCAEALVSGPGVDRHRLTEALAPLGDSLIVAGSEGRLHIHIHTDDPVRTFATLAAAGRVAQPKVDDMRSQDATVSERKYPIALVTDSACDLPRELIERYQIQVVPLHILSGESEYLDGLTIDPLRFFELAERSKRFPTSSQPPESTFARLFSQLAAHYDSIIAVHLSSRLSGTYQASARAAASLADGAKISIVDSRHVSASLGLIVLRAAEALASGGNHDEIVAETEAAVLKAEILVGVRTLRFMVRGGRVSPLGGVVANALNLKPIVSLDKSGDSILRGRPLSVRSNVKKMVETVARIHAETPLRCYAVVHGHDPEAGRRFASQLERELGFAALFVEEISSVVALNAGRGAVSVAVMRE
jgi:DegV family protein with EDD domain